MCGIAGYILKARVEDRSEADLDALLKSIRMRGPDDEGICLIDRQRQLFRPYRTE